MGRRSQSLYSVEDVATTITALEGLAATTMTLRETTAAVSALQDAVATNMLWREKETATTTTTAEAGTLAHKVLNSAGSSPNPPSAPVAEDQIIISVGPSLGLLRGTEATEPRSETGSSALANPSGGCYPRCWRKSLGAQDFACQSPYL